MKDNPFFHLFKTPIGFYLYDVNTDKILKIPESVYVHLLAGDSSVDESAIDYVKELKDKGFLKSNRVLRTMHPLTELLPYYSKNRLSHIILQITQSCNLRCSYCVYSGKYKNRTHSNKKMTFSTAKKAIDLLITNSRDSKELIVGFYGGEPLLCLGMVKQCINYTINQSEGRKVRFSITTNATLLTEEIVAYFSENDVSLTISLDGPKHIHDKYRKYKKSNKGSYEKLISNVQMIRDKFPDYYMERVLFNTVLVPDSDFSCINEFILSNKMIDGVQLITSLLDDKYIDNTISYSEKFVEEQSYEVFKLFLYRLGWLTDFEPSNLVLEFFAQSSRIRKDKYFIDINQLPETSHHGGPCMPFSRLFVSTDGDFFPCERVSESSEIAKIGNIDCGIDLDKAEKILNIERATAAMCYECWAYRYCQVCIGAADDLKEISPTLIKKRCSSVKQSTEEAFKDYCVFKELGFDFELGDTYAQLINQRGENY